MDNLDWMKNTFTALITPFDKDLNVDWEILESFIEFQIKNGVGLVPMGTTGESATMSHEEHHEIVEFVINKTNKRTKVIAGTGSNSTREAVSLTKHAENAGADAALIITPYYNRPTQKGLYEHFKRISESTSLPIVIYNVPSRTGCNILPDTIEKLSHFNNIRGYKAASGKIEQIKEVINKTPDDFIVLSGDDGLTYDIMALGGKGVISVASNIIPAKINEFTKLMNEGKNENGLKLFNDMKETNSQMAIVVDEFGGTAGIVSLVGLVEEIVGEMGDELTTSQNVYEIINDYAFQIDGSMRVDEINEEMGLGLPESDEYETIAGFILYLSGHIPKVREQIEYKDLKIQVTEMRGLRISKVQVTKEGNVPSKN